MTSPLSIDALHYKTHSKSQYIQAYELLKNIDISPEACILDVGCGHGEIVAELSRMAPYGKSVGIDPSANMISLASESYPESQYKNLEFSQVKAEDMKFPSNSFDLIICTNVFMWIRNPHRAVKLISRFLKPGGRFILFTYSKDTPYVTLFENVLESSFPELKDQSAVNTMLSSDHHLDILLNNHMSLELFKLEEVELRYENEDDFKNYIEGWLTCYAPLSSGQQQTFLKKLIVETENFKIEVPSKEILIPHKTISIIATKRSTSD